MSVRTLSVTGLRELLAADPAPTLLSVDPEAVFAEAHLPGSLRNAVYEMGFVERMEGLAPDREMALVLYSAAAGSHAAAFAGEKLERAGYRHLFVFSDGLEAWRAAGNAVAGEGAPEEEPISPPAGRLELDAANSRLHWVGRNLANLHEGTLGLKSGWVELAAGELRAGELVLDMMAITCSDLTDTQLNGVLLRHLADHDFFDVERFPEARVELLDIRHEPEEAAGRPNYFGTAKLHLRGRENTLRFALVGGVGPKGAFSLQGPVSFDRTQWGVLYGSGRFFARLGMHLVNDFIDLDLRLNFKRPDGSRISPAA